MPFSPVPRFTERTGKLFITERTCSSDKRSSLVGSRTQNDHASWHALVSPRPSANLRSLTVSVELSRDCDAKTAMAATSLVLDAEKTPPVSPAANQFSGGAATRPAARAIGRSRYGVRLSQPASGFEFNGVTL